MAPQYCSYGSAGMPAVPATIFMSEWASKQAYKYDSKQVCKWLYASVPVCKYTRMKVCKYASKYMHFRKYVRMQVFY